jgi:opacity protein-like surface antigen
MAKKNLLVLVMVVFAAHGVFAAPELKLSAGVGGIANMGMGGGYEYPNGKTEIYMPAVDGGVFAFFDATFVELSLSFSGGFSRFKTFSPTIADTDFSTTNFTIGLLGKYPFEITQKFSLFPLLGIEYQIVTSLKTEDGNDLKNAKGEDASGDFNALWFKLGAGMDYSFTEKIYLRANLLYGIRLPNKFEEDSVEYLKNANVLVGQGMTIKLAVGYRF